MNLTATQIADLIDEAVETLERCPWGQGTGRRLEQRICAEDAVWMAVSGTKTAAEHWNQSFLGSKLLEEISRKADAVEYVIADHIGIRRGDLYIWNDAQRRTKQEVIDAFKETAKELRNQSSLT